MWESWVRILGNSELDHTHQIFILLGVSLSFANTLAMKKCKRHVAPTCEGVGQREGQWSPTSVAEWRPSYGLHTIFGHLMHLLSMCP